MFKKIKDWFHRHTVISGKSCIRRDCEEFHGISPTAHLHWANRKNHFL